MGRVSGVSPLKSPDGPRRPTVLVGRTLTRTMRRWGQGKRPARSSGWAAVGEPLARAAPHWAS